MKLILADTGTISRKLTLVDEFVVAFDLANCGKCDNKNGVIQLDKWLQISSWGK